MSYERFQDPKLWDAEDHFATEKHIGSFCPNCGHAEMLDVLQEADQYKDFGKESFVEFVAKLINKIGKEHRERAMSISTHIEFQECLDDNGTWLLDVLTEEIE